MEGHRWKLSLLKGVEPPSDNEVIIEQEGAPATRIVCSRECSFNIVYIRSRANEVNGHPWFHFGVRAHGKFTVDGTTEYNFMLLDWHGDKEVYLTVGNDARIGFALTADGNRDFMNACVWGPIAALEEPYKLGFKARMGNDIPQGQFEVMQETRTLGSKTPKEVAERLFQHIPNLKDSASCAHLCYAIWSNW